MTTKILAVVAIVIGTSSLGLGIYNCSSTPAPVAEVTADAATDAATDEATTDTMDASTDK